MSATTGTPPADYTVMRRALLSVLVIGLQTALASGEKSSNGNGSTGNSVISEMNLARQNPALYATFVEQLRDHLTGNTIVLPGGTKIRTREGTGALNEAIRFLRGGRSVWLAREIWTVGSTEFAGGYTELGQLPTPTLVARNY